MKKVLTLVFTLITLISTCLAGPAKSIAPKREMRAAWIASVENIDWPSKAGLSAEEQKKELTALALRRCALRIENGALVEVPNREARCSTAIGV